MNCLMPWVASQVTAWPERRGSGVPLGGKRADTQEDVPLFSVSSKIVFPAKQIVIDTGVVGTRQVEGRRH